MTLPASGAEAAVLERPRGAPPRVDLPQPAHHPIIAIEAPPPAEDRFSLVDAAYRVFEFSAALAALVVTLPIILLEAAIIRLDSPGRALFFQERCGRSRRVRGSELAGRADVMPAPGTHFEPDKWYWVPTTFRFVKFRTMYVDARQRHPHLYQREFESHEQFRAAYHKRDNDPRVTRVGKWLRRLTVDELPNLWNVLCGNVALVGPRPETPNYVHYYSADEMPKFTVRPGVTCLAVVHGRGELNIGESIDWDLEYVRSRTVAMDLRIIFVTAWLVVVRRGAF